MKLYNDLYEKIKGTAVDELAYPRKFSVPPGYASPKTMAATLAIESASSVLLDRSGRTDIPLTNSLSATIKLIEYKVPTYFVDENLCRAVDRTEPPSSVSMADIKWPMPAMMFVLPDRFLVEKFGVPIYNIRVIRFDKTHEVLDLPITTPYGGMRPITFESQTPPIIMIAFHFFAPGADQPTNFFMRLRLDESLIETQHDLMLSLDRMDGLKLSYGNMTPDQEKIITSNVGMFIIKLLLAMTARPSFMISEGTCARQAKVGKGRPALWNPSFIGQGYRLQSEVKSGAGTHGSPIMHWRDGHFRSQPYGEGRALRKVLWIESVLVNAPEEKE